MADGRALSQKLTLGVVPGILIIATLAAVILIVASLPSVVGRLGPNGATELNQAGLILVMLTSIGLLLVATKRGQKLYCEHLRHGELVLAQTQTIIANTHDGVVVMDQYGRIQSMNPAGEKIFGQPVSRVLGQNISVLIPDRAVWQDSTPFPRTTLTNGQRPSNQTFPLELSVSELMLDGRRSLVAIVHDASASERSSDTLRQIGQGVTPTPGLDGTRAMLRQLSKAVGTNRAFIVELLGEGQSAVAMLTISENGDLRGAVATELRNSLCAEVLGKGFQLIAAGARQQYPEDAIINENAADSIAAMPLVDHRGRAVGVIGVLQEKRLEEPAAIESTLQIFASRAAAEIERKRSEEALAAEKERLAVTLRSIGDACITLDNDGRVVMFNPVAERLTGWVHEDATGKLVNDVLHLVDERTRRRSQHLIQRIVTTGASDAAGSLHLLISLENEERLVETSSSPIRDRLGRKLGAIIVLRDVTERRRAEEERQKAEKLESLGLVAGGIAHDFNNILTTILGNVSLVLGGAEVPGPITERLGAARKAAQRAQELAGQLLTFAKGGAPVKQSINLGQFLIDTVHCAVAGSHTTCDTQVAEDLWPVDADPGQLAQVIANITVNADQAMPSGGALLVSAENADLPVESVALGLAAGRWVRFTIEDHGVGIPEEYLTKIFDPYFTTKPTGSGLGLAAAYSIVKNHGGVIHVESTPTVGSTFNVYLPASEKPIESKAPEPSTPSPTPIGTGRVLILDDEEAICMLVTCALEPLGYEVTETQDGLVALEKYAEALKSGRKYDLVISDLTMPGRMSGQEAIRRLRELDPDVRAIVSSGYANDPVMSRYQEFGFCGMIAKPYEIDALGRKVAEIMAQPMPPRVIYHSFEERKTA
ncbi:MAG: PAS domain S-box protein [Chthoniobacteraceae bacterium]